MIGDSKRTKICLIVLVFSLLYAAAAKSRAAADPMNTIEISFQLPQVRGNPFDFTANDVRVTFSTPSGKDISLPAFFNGDTTWKVRHTPDAAGKYSVRSVTLNGQDAKAQRLSQSSFEIPAVADHGFVRIEPKDKMRFAFDDGTPFYPVGYNLAWRQHGSVEMPPLVDSLARMGAAGVNWTRIWMNSWDGKNLDWPSNKADRVEPGTLLLPVARDWDAIVSAAQQNHIQFQMVLQHHGQFNLTNDTNWAGNPWNKAHGGWLTSPEQFFTDPRAIQLTKNKYRYIIARWGYSPAIMAFELFNEVESTDGYKKDLPSVAAWHRTMADFIRQQDPYHHLITTSSNTTEKSIWPATDYYQAHAYPSDLISAIAGLEDENLPRPYFFGEMGGSSTGTPVPPRDTLHRILWASLMSGSAGTGEYWDWFEVEPRNLLGQFTSVQEFIRQSGMLNDRELRPVPLDAQTPKRGPLVFGPGRDWTSSTTQFIVHPSGSVELLGGMSAFLQGRGANHAMFPFAEFKVDFTEAGSFAVQIDQTTLAGARLQASVDGKLVAALTINRANPSQHQGQRRSDNQHITFDDTLEVPVTAGSHTVRLENTGDDWVHIRQFMLTPYASEIAVLGKTSRNRALLWAYRRDTGDNRAVTATIKVDGLSSGTYQVVWWDTDAGKILTQTTAQADTGQPLTLTTPPIIADAGCWIVRSN